MTPYLRACAEALWFKRDLASRQATSEDPILACCGTGAILLDVVRHRRSRTHCRALVARAAAGEAVPEDVREVMRLDKANADFIFVSGVAMDDLLRHSFTTSETRKRAVLAHAVAPGARRDSWLLRLDTAEGTRWGVIVELPGSAVQRCPTRGCDGAQGERGRNDPFVVCTRCREMRHETGWARRLPPVHLREQHDTLLDAVNVLALCGPAQLQRVLGQIEAAGLREQLPLGLYVHQPTRSEWGDAP